MCVCLEVLDWIENHGEAFLSKHTGVGKSLHRARALQKRHEDFEEVAQVSFKKTHRILNIDPALVQIYCILKHQTQMLDKLSVVHLNNCLQSIKSVMK